jgi:phenylacetic acid degradation operon negative regulatory protein
MQPKTEELLNLLLWSADMLARPTFRNLTDSYESWAYRNGLLPQVTRLEKKKLLERDPKSAGDRIYRLTEQGRVHALGGRDPEAQWSRPWDGRWRLALFDFPVEEGTRRQRFRRYLIERGFGCLQGSVWVTPDPVEREREHLQGGRVNVGSLLLLDARPCAGESDLDIVCGAWDFERINLAYRKHMKVLTARPSEPLRSNAAIKALQEWANEERHAWLAAVTRDPLLPERLLPPDYVGRRAWQRRKEVFRQAGQQLRSYQGRKQPIVAGA